MEVLLGTFGRLDVKSLLFLHLLFLKAAAQCTRHQGKENMVLTNEALLMNSFPEGSQSSLECANGYIRESGSGTIYCSSGNWSEPDLICKKMDCGQPKAQPNMSFNTSAGTLFGAVITVICDKGYDISGSSYRYCYPTGWRGKSTCEMVTCEQPGQVINGKSLWDSQDDPKYEDIIQYVCNEGYTLIGKDKIMCSETGEYDPQPPECKENEIIGVTTEDRMTANVVTPTSTPPTEEASSTPKSSATETAHRHKTITTSAVTLSATVSPSAQGGGDTFTVKGTGDSVTSTTPSSLQELDKQDGALDTNKNTGYTPVVISVICVLLVACIAVFFIHKLFLRRKGSYDTKEDLKPELLYFQNL